MKVTMKEKHLCGWCGRKVTNINPNTKLQYCNEQHERLHKDWKKSGFKKHL